MRAQFHGHSTQTQKGTSDGHRIIITKLPPNEAKQWTTSFCGVGKCSEKLVSLVVFRSGLRSFSLTLRSLLCAEISGQGRLAQLLEEAQVQNIQTRLRRQGHCCRRYRPSQAGSLLSFSPFSVFSLCSSCRQRRVVFAGVRNAIQAR